jgi:hypothetical protein
MTDRWTDRLSEYLDDQLVPAERAELEVHVAGCADCRTTLAELRRVLDVARALPDSAPPTDLWPAIRARIAEAESGVVPIHGSPMTAAAPVRRRFTFTLPQLAAACVSLLCAGALGGWIALNASDPAQTDPATVARGAAQGDVIAVTASTVAPDVDARIADLERALSESRELLEPETIAVLERNLAIVEAALQEAQRALSLDPANDYLRNHVERTMLTKLDVLQRATSLARAET